MRNQDGFDRRGADSRQPGRGALNGQNRASSPMPARRTRPDTPQGSPPESGVPRGRRVLQRQPRVRNRWFTAIVMVGATVACCFLFASFIMQSASDLFGLNQEDNQVAVTVPKNSDLSDIAYLLNKSGVVDQPLTFQLYAGLKAKLKKAETVIKPGNYVFNSNMGYDQILVLLKTGDIKNEEVKITFVEGLTLLDIAKTLEEKEVCKADDFIDYLQSTNFNYDYYSEIEKSPLRFMELEGYIFPDTYQFYIGEKVSSVAKKFLDNFNNRINDDMKKRMSELNMTIDETITLASVIQKEAGDPSQMRRVSSVFHNRLNNPKDFPQLQSDVTIFYVEFSIKRTLQNVNQQMYDAYNTYVCEGLPVGPVCNPGLEAITAALYPAETDYYFFVTDINEEYYYSETANEHYKNVIIAGKQTKDGKSDVHGTDTRDE